MINPPHIYSRLARMSYIIIITVAPYPHPHPDGAVVMSSANGLVGTGFVYLYRLQPIAGF